MERSAGQVTRLDFEAKVFCKASGKTILFPLDYGDSSRTHCAVIPDYIMRKLEIESSDEVYITIAVRKRRA